MIELIYIQVCLVDSTLKAMFPRCVCLPAPATSYPESKTRPLFSSMCFLLAQCPEPGFYVTSALSSEIPEARPVESHIKVDLRIIYFASAGIRGLGVPCIVTTFFGGL